MIQYPGVVDRETESIDFVHEPSVCQQQTTLRVCNSCGALFAVAVTVINHQSFIIILFKSDHWSIHIRKIEIEKIQKHKRKQK